MAVSEKRLITSLSWLVLIFSVVLASSRIKAAPYSSIDDTRAYFYDYQSVVFRGMALSGRAFWLEGFPYSLNPAAIRYMDDYDLLPVLNIGYDLSFGAEDIFVLMTDRTDFLSTMILTEKEFSESRDKDYTLKLFWNPLQFKHGDWLFSVQAATFQDVVLERDSSMVMPPGQVLARADFIYRSDFVARVGRAVEIFSGATSSLAIGMNLRLAYSFFGIEQGFLGPNERRSVFYSPIPPDMKDMDTKLGYAVDFGTAGEYVPLHIKYGLVAEGAMGQLRYVRTRTLFNLGLGWQAKIPREGKRPKSNLTVGSEICGLGEYGFDEAFHLGGQFEYKGFFVRGGYNNKDISSGLGLSKNWFDFHYAYFSSRGKNPAGENGQNPGYNHGFEVYFRF